MVMFNKMLKSRIEDSVSSSTVSTNETGNATSVTCRNDYCVSDEDYLEMIGEYIFPTAFEWTFIVLYAVVFAAGLVGNALVCFVVWRNHHMRTVTNVFIASLSAADLIVILVCLPPTVLVDVTETWYMGRVVCKLVHYIQGVSVSVSVMTLMFISIERYYAICHPLRCQSTPFRAKACIILIWVISLILLLPDAIVLDVHRMWPEDFTLLLTSCRPTWADESQTRYQLFLLVALYFLPLGIMAFAYVRIACCLWTNLIPKPLNIAGRRHVVSRLGTNNASILSRCDVNIQTLARRKVAKMLIAVVVVFAICYLPVHLLNIFRYGRVGISDVAATHLAIVAHWCCYFNSALNPIIYNFMSARFLQSFRRACNNLSCSRDHDVDNFKQTKSRHQRVAMGTPVVTPEAIALHVISEVKRAGARSDTVRAEIKPAAFKTTL